ncbi:MAG TPA: rhodanese-like domain-containing protein [Candidatus Acidoferrum sp.]|nr:rhodanese-like domain-containing protein [Candidatus Acidoferrum sp.]
MTPSITVAGLRNQEIGHAGLVDVRSPAEFAAGHIPGAVNIPMEQIESRLDDLNPNGPVILICQTGERARKVAALLEPCHRPVAVLDGGTRAWIEAGLPLVTSVKTRWSLERQVRLAAGLLVLAGALLALSVDLHWLLLSAFVGLGLALAGITDVCPMAKILGKMPWNSSRHSEPSAGKPGLSPPRSEGGSRSRGGAVK